jgi:acyl-CoA dehydrogenase
MQASTLSTQSAPFELPPLEAEIRTQAQELAARFGTRHREVRLHPFEHGELHPELWREICDRGWPGLLVPSARGGAEGGLLAYVVMMEALAESNLILWMPVLTAAIAHAIAEVGPEHTCERWLGRIAAGQTFLALAVTEPQCGHNVFRSATTVRREGEHFVISGVKAVTSGIDLAERVLVFASARSSASARSGPSRRSSIRSHPCTRVSKPHGCSSTGPPSASTTAPRRWLWPGRRTWQSC